MLIINSVFHRDNFLSRAMVPANFYMLAGFTNASLKNESVYRVNDVNTGANWVDLPTLFLHVSRRHYRDRETCTNGKVGFFETFLSVLPSGHICHCSTLQDIYFRYIYILFESMYLILYESRNILYPRVFFE